MNSLFLDFFFFIIYKFISLSVCFLSYKLHARIEKETETRERERERETRERRRNEIIITRDPTILQRQQQPSWILLLLGEI